MKLSILATIGILFLATNSVTFASESDKGLQITPDDLSQALKAFKAFEENPIGKMQSSSSTDVNIEESPNSADIARAISISGIPARLESRRLSDGSSGSFDTQGCSQHEQPRWLLSLDGGGIRGLMQLQIIAEIERLTGKSIIELFDCVSGTSVGGIIACGLTMPDPANPGKPKYTAQDLLDIFCARKTDFFKSKWQSFGGLFGTRYKTKSIKKLLKDILRDNKFSDRLLPTVLVTHNLLTNEEQLISSTDSEDFYTWNVALATGAAPTYFKPQRIFPIGAHPSHRGYVLSDGGTCMNNPTMAGIALLHDVYKIDADDLNVLSLGTGTSVTTQLNKRLLKGGILTWGVTIADTCIAGQASSTNKLAELYCKNRYHRLNPILDQNNLGLDDISESNQEVLFTASLQCIKKNFEEINEIITSLMKSYKRKQKIIRNHLQANTSENPISSKESLLLQSKQVSESSDKSI